ncbi:MAG: hypothetical protein FJ291_32690, partial [Planctomycetes bacterium]|nr:hypothetical protein [Planctomycetota bacterium]
MSAMVQHSVECWTIAQVSMQSQGSGERDACSYAQRPGRSQGDRLAAISCASPSLRSNHHGDAESTEKIRGRGTRTIEEEGHATRLTGGHGWLESLERSFRSFEGLLMHYPAFPDFQRLAERANVVPVYRQLLADTLTPVSAFQKLNVGMHGFLLESVTGGERIGRYSLLGTDPQGTIRATRNSVEVARGGQARRYESDDPLRDIEELLAHTRSVRVPGLDCFAGGVVGYLAYDVVRYVERLPNPPPDDRGLPDYYLMACDTLVVFDHVFKTIKVVHNARLQGRSAREAYADAVATIDAVVERLRTPVTTLTDDIRPSGEITLRYDSTFARPEYEAVVERCKEYILAGDVVQVVPSQRLSVETAAEPFDVYRTLRVINPSPWMFYLKLGDIILVGASPEIMVKLEGDKVTVRPIAGTRRRGATPEEDDALAAELIGDPKERAEHVMLLDLGRNDVGRVALPGTVKITEQMVVERYSHVMHITSNVEGTLDRRRHGPFDVLRACLPAGTV